MQCHRHFVNENLKIQLYILRAVDTKYKVRMSPDQTLNIDKRIQNKTLVSYQLMAVLTIYILTYPVRLVYDPAFWRTPNSLFTSGISFMEGSILLTFPNSRDMGIATLKFRNFNLITGT